MFTGIVAELGEVAGVDHHGDAARLTIRGSTEGVALGELPAEGGCQALGHGRLAAARHPHHDDDVGGDLTTCCDHDPDANVIWLTPARWVVSFVMLATDR